jgi:hypothetical protein
MQVGCVCQDFGPHQVFRESTGQDKPIPNGVAVFGGEAEKLYSETHAAGVWAMGPVICAGLFDSLNV